MRYLVRLESARFVANNRKFGVFDCREFNNSGELGGWASIVFRGAVPNFEEGVIEVWGEWASNDQYGMQLIARSWIWHDKLPASVQEEPEPHIPDNSDSKNPATDN